MHMHTPPKSFHPSVDKTHTRREKTKLGAYVKEEISIQNMTEKNGGIYIIRTTGNRQRGGGTYTAE